MDEGFAFRRDEKAVERRNQVEELKGEGSLVVGRVGAMVGEV